MTDQKIKVYTSPNCMPCLATKRHLTQHNIPYTELPATEHLPHLQTLGHNTTPIIETPTGDHWSGHRPTKLDGLRRTSRLHQPIDTTGGPHPTR